ncbi:MAG TPA: phosphoesterase [Candidatus Paceibacterota bacterium]
MKIHVMSDVHLEFGRWPKDVDVNAIDADVSVLAGDIGIGLEGIEWALSFDRPVIYVLGNHEFYGQRPMLELWKKAHKKVESTHVHLLENASILIDDPRNPGERVRFLGATLWTDFCALGPERQEDCMESAKRSMSDYSTIYVSRRGHRIAEPGFASIHQGDRLTPRKTLAMHHESRDFLERELNRSPDVLGMMDNWSKTVVVTHHAPSVLSFAGKKAVSTISAAYASNLDHIVEQADIWIHGHTHFKNDYRVGNGRVVCNPRGYLPEEKVKEFDPACVIEI